MAWRVMLPKRVIPLSLPNNTTRGRGVIRGVSYAPTPPWGFYTAGPWFSWVSYKSSSLTDVSADMAARIFEDLLGRTLGKVLIPRTYCCVPTRGTPMKNHDSTTDPKHFLQWGKAGHEAAPNTRA
jgi:hypothetical protein